MKHVFFLLSVAAFSLAFTSCSGSKEVENIPADIRFQQAKALYDDEKYLEAIEEFKIVIVQHQGSEYADDAQFYLAESRFNRDEFILAAAEFDNLVRTMPTSQFAALSRYKKGLSHYLLSPKPQLDQKYSRYAIDDFQTFIEYSPKDTMVGDTEQKISELTEKLAKKIFESGKLYYRMDYFRASIAYFDKVIAEYNDTPYADDALLWKARSQNERKDFPGARSTINDLVAKYPDTELRPDISELQTEITENESEFLEDQLAKNRCRMNDMLPLKRYQADMTQLVLPNDTNQLGNLLGGQLMHWIDLVAAIAAARHSKRVCVTASVDELNFIHPIKLGEVVTLLASVNRVFRTSMEVGVKVLSENLLTGEIRHANTAYLTFVALGQEGKPVAVPPIEIGSDEEKRRYEDASIRRDERLKRRNKLQR